MKQNSKRQNKGFFEQVYEIVKEIPLGKVMTYGQIAEILGTKDARKVGWALHANKDINCPCHRVVNKEGKVSHSYAFGGYMEQKDKLLGEGVTFLDELRVDLGKCKYVD